MATSTAQQALLAELLGEVGQLQEQVQGLRAALAEMSQHATTQLEAHTGRLIAAAERLQDVVLQLDQHIDQQVSSAAHAAADAARLEIRATAAQAAADSVGQTVGAEIQQAVASITSAAEQLRQDTAQATRHVRAAARQVAWGWTKQLALVLGASLLGGLAAVIGLVGVGFI